MDTFINLRKVFNIGCERTKLSAECINTGRGLQVLLIGGTSPHIGAVVMALPRPSLKTKKINSSDSYVLTVPGHKDYIIATQMASDIAKILNIVIVVTVGIHSDNMINKEIQEIIANSISLTETICSEFNQRKIN